MSKQTAETFWAKVDIRGEDECWLWTASCSDKGYGRLTWGRKTRRAHRVAYALANPGTPFGAPADLASYGFVLHKCDLRNCCNPRHLFLGTYSDNITDMYRKGRGPQAKLSPANIEEILSTSRSAESIKRFSIRFGVTRNCIRYVFQKGKK